MAGFDIVIADYCGIVFHVPCGFGIDMFGYRIDIVIIIGRIVALQDVPDIYQQHVVLPESFPFGADVGRYLCQIIIFAVDVICRKYVHPVCTVFKPAA